mgnify:CR=1 FL=1
MKVILANGVFDILHVGHIMYLEKAKAMGDCLVVAVTRDRHVNKGPGRPTNPEEHRLAVIKAVRWVDDAILVDEPIEAFDLIRPDIFCKGRDYIGKIQQRHMDECARRGIQIAFTDTPIFSATKIINDRLRTG